MKNLSILMALNSHEDNRKEQALKIKNILEKNDVKVQMISIPYSKKTKNNNYDSVLVWKFIGLETERFIALDLLAGTIQNEAGVIWLVDKDNLSSHSNSIGVHEWKEIRQRIIKKCKNKKIIANSKEIADYYKELLDMEIEVKSIPSETADSSAVLDFMEVIEG